MFNKILQELNDLGASKNGNLTMPDIRQVISNLDPDLTDRAVDKALFAVLQASKACSVDCKKLCTWLAEDPQGANAILMRSKMNDHSNFDEEEEATLEGEPPSLSVVNVLSAPDVENVVERVETHWHIHKLQHNSKGHRHATMDDGCLSIALARGSEGEESPDTKDKDFLRSTNPIALDSFRRKLEKAGVNTTLFGVGTAKPLEELHWEVYTERQCKLAPMEDGSMKRIVQIVQADVVSQDMFGTWRHLVSNMQLLHDGRQRRRKDLLVRMFPDTESWEEAVSKAIAVKLSMDAQMQKKHMHIDKSSHQYHEKEEQSQGYPGLMTVYQMHKVNVHVQYSVLGLANIGLPEGRDFAVMEGAVGGNHLGARLFLWSWEPTSAPSVQPNRRASIENDIVIRRRVPTLDSLKASTTTSAAGSSGPNSMLESLMANVKTDWSRVKNAAEKIRDPKYSLKAFHEDVTLGFPELKLYLQTEGKTTSGRSGDDEFQRTIGALYAVYWLMRLDIDGKEGFTFGVDDDWNPRAKPEGEDEHLSADSKKKVTFYDETEWSWFSDLFISAGILKREEQGLSVCFDGCLAMLSLTAIHDIMKVDLLLPTVSKKDAPFRGFAEGAKINDHDIALGYVLEKFPDLLPSFAGLDEKQRRLVDFTQSKLEYNQGWLVQAEAPPIALFKSFKSLLKQGGFDATTVSFYFVHWLTDLAGAEPYPLEGSEKFVLKFPHAVLKAFLRSFPVVRELADESETEVYERYLCTRWKEHKPELGPLPTNCLESVALMRLACQAQANAVAVLDAFTELADEEKWYLSKEMARTGCAGQDYSCLGDGDVIQEGPAVLVYYGPALLQQKFGGGKTEVVLALRRLCEVYRQARSLRQNNSKDIGHLVVRIDAIKDLTHQQICNHMTNGQVFMLVQINDLEAFVEMHSLTTLAELCEEKVGKFRFLDFAFQKVASI